MKKEFIAATALIIISSLLKICSIIALLQFNTKLISSTEFPAKQKAVKENAINLQT